MVLALSADQESALAQDTHRVLVAVKIDLTTDLLYCSGEETVTLDSITFIPRALHLGRTEMTVPRQSHCTIELDDTDGVIAAVWYGERFSGQTITIKEAIKLDGAWVVIRSIPWICTTCERKQDGTFVLNLSGAGGMKPRAGLQVAARDDWHLAPEPGAALRVGAGSAGWIG